jgi:hypothetical protein
VRGYGDGADGARWRAADDCGFRSEGILEGKAEGGGFLVRVARRRLVEAEVSG